MSRLSVRVAVCTAAVCQMFLSVGLFTAMSGTATSLNAQMGTDGQYARDPKQALDEVYTARIKQYTTGANFIPLLWTICLLRERYLLRRRSWATFRERRTCCLMQRMCTSVFGCWRTLRRGVRPCVLHHGDHSLTRDWRSDSPDGACLSLGRRRFIVHPPYPIAHDHADYAGG